MYRRTGIALLAFCLAFTLFLPKTFAKTEQDLASSAVSAVLMDADTGTILFEKNSHQKLPPASITKVMTLLLVMEALDEGKISLKDKVRISENAASMGGSQIFLEPGETMSVQDLLKAVAVASANDASVALAEFLGGTEQHFVQMMNDKAKKLGLKNTHFQNTNGLPAEDHYSSAYDIAVMSRELLKHPEITRYTGIYQDYLRQQSKKPFWLVNTNKLVRYYQGVDGIKTGYTSEAGFCLSATAKRGNFRVIAVVMGEPDVKKRNQEVSGMLDYAFNQYTSHLVYKKGDLIAEKEIDKGDPETIKIRASHSFSILVKKGDDGKGITKSVIWKELKAPIHKGEILGKIEFSKNGRKIAEMEIISAKEVKEANLWSSVKRVVNRVLFLPRETEEKE
ncbi:D-alanyl-D-alanine carboxypeptidase family protein [Paenactinomyces guangxiensis]|uniref:serine-type D-Ala-D-Ala carboxypeptidase n=1 Tax=Paenactinomyces guangxiensis TaxID=1490290 RepID=A0A7W2A9G1_9BACL|nr:D-alanyl-D-alanine carboxypeptidase family protein [Paenactinomyces guangxiensis]MBA4495695.1 D-alanyl-D-alanine carboxypeptidase [Paenactinomyces guangxiensis]MBH8592683.1 D-alanyl-D-alanine carboxypeptidase [Paenactinomyces guangxiensis]